jgi:hypothetical protein
MTFLKLWINETIQGLASFSFLLLLVLATVIDPGWAQFPSRSSMNQAAWAVWRSKSSRVRWRAHATSEWEFFKPVQWMSLRRWRSLVGCNTKVIEGLQSLVRSSAKFFSSLKLGGLMLPRIDVSIFQISTATHPCTNRVFLLFIFLNTQVHLYCVAVVTATGRTWQSRYSRYWWIVQRFWKSC